MVLDIAGMTGVQPILRLNGAVKHDAAVELWLNGEPQELRSIARQWFAAMRKCGGDLCELMHDGCPVACVADAPFAYANAFKSHINVGFFHGASLEDPAGLLEGTGKRMRHVKLKPGSELNTAALAALIDAAYADIKLRLSAD